jgi:hypothetical protein
MNSAANRRAVSSSTSAAMDSPASHTDRWIPGAVPYMPYATLVMSTIIGWSSR